MRNPSSRTNTEKDIANKRCAVVYMEYTGDVAIPANRATLMQGKHEALKGPCFKTNQFESDIDD